MKNKFQVIVADCPWSFKDTLSMSSTKRGAGNNYDTMSLDELKQLPVKNIADPNGCVLVLWCPSSLLEAGLEVMKSWSFSLKQTYIWTKTKKAQDLKINEALAFGMGRFFRNCHEIALIGINNTEIYKKLQNKSQRTVSFAPNLGHSVKPETLQDSLDLMLPHADKIELFARRDRKGWTCLGNECPSSKGEDIVVSLKKLL